MRIAVSDSFAQFAIDIIIELMKINKLDYY